MISLQESGERKKILDSLARLKIKGRDWFMRRAHGPHAKAWLIFFSFGEASFFPIPPDILLIAILLAGASRWFQYALITTVTSALGGAFGYFVGIFFFGVAGKFIISFYGLEEEMFRVAQLFEDNAFLTIFTAAFTPVPYKVFTIAAGFFKIDFWVFLLASIVGRGMRFFAIGYAVKLYGKTLGRFIYKYFNILSIIIILWGLIFLLFVRAF